MHNSAFEISRLSLLKLLLSTFIFSFAVTNAQARAAEMRLSVLSLAPAKVRIELQHPARSTWSFRNTYSSIVGLADRIDNLHGIDARGEIVSVRRLASGEYRSNEMLEGISYDVALATPSRLTDIAHVSWLNQEHGLLMLGDLLPQLDDEANKTDSIGLDLVLPPEWTSASSIDPLKNNQYLVSDPERAVFLIGRSLRERSTSVGHTQIRLITPARWAFADGDVIKIAARLIREYARVTKHSGPGKAALVIVPFPETVDPDRWAAAARGASVVLLIGNRASQGAMLARTKVVLGHELFHLWVPNMLALDGDYDWFFEGFTLYQALLTGLRLRYISFRDYLDTLARVYDSYRSSPDHDKLSLLEVSERRWTTATSLVYDKGMLVAFIYDLMLRRQSRGKATLSDIYPQVFLASSAKRQDANHLLVSILSRQEGMQQFAQRFLESASLVDLADALMPFGLVVETTGSKSQIKLNPAVTSEQLRLLNSLGYKRGQK